MSLYRGNSDSCSKCVHTTVCKWANKRNDIISKIESAVVDESTPLSPFTVNVNCSNFEESTKKVRNGGERFVWNF